MPTEFPRILTLLRKEKKLSQKFVASELGVSQALLSHYEKGIRECGLDFLSRCADFFGVSCDYLLGRSPERTGLILTADELPEGDIAQNGRTGSIPLLSKKLLQNSLTILFDILGNTKNRTVITEVSNYLFLSVYVMFRALYGANPKNPESMFSVSELMATPLSYAAQSSAEAKIRAALGGIKVPGVEPIGEFATIEINSATLAAQYPMLATSLLNLLKNAELRIEAIKPQ